MVKTSCDILCTAKCPKIALSWSGGKDSAWALHLLRQQGEYEVAALVTTLNSHFNRVAIHGFREELLDAQAASVGVPLWKIPLPWPCSNEDYESRMGALCERAVAEGFSGFAFGDLFLEDIRAYREKMLAPTGLTPVFPVWGIPTAELARTMIGGGLRARLTCVDLKQLDASFAGREFDESFLRDLPAGVDACGERGEFHTFVHDGPIFRQPVGCSYDHTVERDGYAYAELLPTMETARV
jgi:uncharacterized protein (TIGR00290 family)